MTAVKAIRPLDPNALSASPEEAARYLSVHRRKINDFSLSGDAIGL
jgi:hypothetical protein